MRHVNALLGEYETRQLADTAALYAGELGRGRVKEWGVLIHAALEALVKGLSVGNEEEVRGEIGGKEGESLGAARLQSLAETLSREMLSREELFLKAGSADHGGPAGHVYRALQEIISSAFWQRVMGADHRGTGSRNSAVFHRHPALCHGFYINKPFIDPGDEILRQPRR